MTNQTPSNSVVTDLLPCPFCGGKAQELINFSTRTSRQVCGCGNCGVARPTPEAWNTRALAMQSANTTGSACSLGEMHGMASCFTNAEGVRCCDFCGNPVTTESDELVERERITKLIENDDLFCQLFASNATGEMKPYGFTVGELLAALSQPLGSQEKE